MRYGFYGFTVIPPVSLAHPSNDNDNHYHVTNSCALDPVPEVELIMIITIM